MTMRIGPNGVRGHTAVDDIADRLENKAMKRIYRKMKRLADNPEAYTKPKKIRGGGRHGAIKQDPGYMEHIAVKLTKYGFTITSSRPYMPRLSWKWIRKHQRQMLDYILGHGQGQGGSSDGS